MAVEWLGHLCMKHLPRSSTKCQSRVPLPPDSARGPDARETVPGLTAVMTLWYTQTRAHGVQEDSRSSVPPLSYVAGLLCVLSEVAAAGNLLGSSGSTSLLVLLLLENHLC